MWKVFVYSSETEIWTTKIIHCPRQMTCLPYLTLNGTIYFTCFSVHGVVASHDFYSESDQFWVVQLPYHPCPFEDIERAFTTSGGCVIYVRALAQKEETVLKIWRLNNDQSWQLLWDMGLPILGNCAPMAMHPFDVGIVYVLCQHDHHLVSCNLRTRKITILRDADNDGHQDCFVDESVCVESVNTLWDPRSPPPPPSKCMCRAMVWFLPFVLPRWMESVPRPPQAEMMDTTSLLSYTTSRQATMKRNRDNNCF
ncbi:unnamed protein product [Microthlaspi erraticum]|uniref:F-box protein At3g26010-like beta-propeller domain-containing protein n=1 Tax=Microthlaspi erraticum TaxID=1685480 RepID=A0A6D2L417_9BRAS|nr:unnamed protein product [Microthlaspi erraticum]